MLDRLRALFTSEKEVGDAIAPLDLEASMQRAVLERSATLANRWTTLASLDLRALVKSLVQQVQVGDAEISVWLNRMAIVSSLMPDAAPNSSKTAVEPIVLSIVASLRRAGKGTRLVIGSGSANKIDNGLASLIARAMATRNMLLGGPDDSIEAMASHRSEARLSDSPRPALLSRS